MLIAVVGLALGYRHRLASRLWPEFQAAFPTAEVRSGFVERTIRLTGNTVAEQTVYLVAPYLRGRRSASGSGDFGLVLEELAAPGTRVRKNDPVAAFDRLSMLNRLDDYRASRVEDELSLRTMRADQEVKRGAYHQQVRVAKAAMDKAALDLKTAPVRSAIQAALLEVAFEEAKATYEALLSEARHVEAGERAEIRLAELELREALVEERRAEANVARMVVRAPVEGLVAVSEISRGGEFGRIRVGDQLRPGQPYAQIVNTRSMIIAAAANQVDVEHLRVGARAYVRFDAYPGLSLPAHVHSIGPLSKSRNWRPDYVAETPVSLRLDGSDSRLMPDLTASAEIILHREWGDGIAPREAIFYDEGEQPFAYVQTAAGWQKRELKLGLANNIDVAVHSGLKASEAVAMDEPVPN